MYGTDIAAQLFIIVLFLNFLKFFLEKKNEEQNLFIIFTILIIIFSIKISYSFYGLFILLFLIIYKKKNIIEFIFKRKKFIVFSSFFLLLFFFQNFSNNGCLLYPISQTCFFYDFDWTLKEKEINEMKIFLELWAKSGANPHFTAPNQEEYIKNCFWLKN